MTDDSSKLRPIDDLDYGTQVRTRDNFNKKISNVINRVVSMRFVGHECCSTFGSNYRLSPFNYVYRF